jgi:hypothetical protein
MRIREIVDILKTTELKQIVVGEDDDFIISLLNMAIINIYAKLDILQEEQIVKLYDEKTTYRLQDNSQRVIQVYRGRFEDGNFWEISLNDTNNDSSVFTPQPYILHVPKPTTGDFISVVQTVTPPYITKENIDTVDFIIPPQLLEPIVNYCGYRAYISMNGDQQTENSSHFARFKQSMLEVQKQGLTQYSIMTNTKSLVRGFPSIVEDYNEHNEKE